MPEPAKAQIASTPGLNERAKAALIAKHTPAIAPAPVVQAVKPQDASSSEARVARFAQAQNLPHTSIVTGQPIAPAASLQQEAAKETQSNQNAQSLYEHQKKATASAIAFHDYMDALPQIDTTAPEGFVNDAASQQKMIAPVGGLIGPGATKILAKKMVEQQQADAPGGKNAQVAALHRHVQANPPPLHLLQDLPPKLAVEYQQNLREKLGPVADLRYTAEETAGAEVGKLPGRGKAVGATLMDVANIKTDEDRLKEKQREKTTDLYGSDVANALAKVSPTTSEQLRNSARKTFEQFNGTPADIGGKLIEFGSNAAPFFIPYIGPILGGLDIAGQAQIAAEDALLAQNPHADLKDVHTKALLTAVAKGAWGALTAYIGLGGKGLGGIAKAGASGAAIEAGSEAIGHVGHGQEIDPKQIMAAGATMGLMHALNPMHAPALAQSVFDKVRNSAIPEKLDSFMNAVMERTQGQKQPPPRPMTFDGRQDHRPIVPASEPPIANMAQRAQQHNQERAEYAAENRDAERSIFNQKAKAGAAEAQDEEQSYDVENQEVERRLRMNPPPGRPIVPAAEPPVVNMHQRAQEQTAIREAAKNQETAAQTAQQETAGRSVFDAEMKKPAVDVRPGEVGQRPPESVEEVAIEASQHPEAGREDLNKILGKSVFDKEAANAVGERSTAEVGKQPVGAQGAGAVGSSRVQRGEQGSQPAGANPLQETDQGTAPKKQVAAQVAEPAPGVTLDSPSLEYKNETIRQQMLDAQQRGWDYLKWARNFPKTAKLLKSKGRFMWDEASGVKPKGTENVQSTPVRQEEPAAPGQGQAAAVPEGQSQEQVEGSAAPKEQAAAEPAQHGAADNAAPDANADVNVGKKAKKPAADDNITARRKQLTTQLRDLIANEKGPGISELPPGHPIATQIAKGETGPGSIISPETAMKMADEFPEGHPAKLLAHNIRELGKNPRGTKFKTYNTNDVPDGSRIVVNDSAEPMRVERQQGQVINDITADIPEGGMDLVGKKLLPPDDSKALLEPTPPEMPSKIQPGVFGQPEMIAKTSGEQKPLQFEHEPKPAEPIKRTGKDAKIAEKFDETATPQLPLETKPAEAGPPLTDSLEKIAEWAEKKLKEGGSAAAKPVPKGSRRGAVMNPADVLLHAIIGVNKINRGVKKFTAWAEEMNREYGLSGKVLDQVWLQARRMAAMSDKDRASYIQKNLSVPATETLRQTVDRETGVSTRRANAELDNLHTAMAMISRQAKGAFKEGVEQVTELKEKLARIVREHLPLDQRGRLLGDVAGAATFGDVKKAIAKTSEVLADVDLKAAKKQIERFTGELKLDLPKVIRTSEKTEAEMREQEGQRKVEALKRKPIREIDITKIDPAYRDQLKPLLEEAKSVHAGMKGAETVDEKYAVIHQFQNLFDRIYEVMSRHDAEHTMKVGNDKSSVALKRQQIVQQVQSQKQIGQPKAEENAPPKNRNIFRRLIGQRSATPSTIIMDFDQSFHPDGNAGQVLLRDQRRGENARDGEVRQFVQHRDQALQDAGYKPHTKKFADFLTEPEDINLPDGRKLRMTKSQQLGLYGWIGDPETRAQVERYGRARFNFQRDLAAEPIELSTSDIDHITSRLSGQEKNLVDSGFKEYNAANLRDRFLDSYYEMHGRAPEPHEGYYPRRVNHEKIESLGEPPSMRQMKRALENVSEGESRGRHDQVYVMPDFIADTDKFISDTANAIHMAKPARIARMILEHPDMKMAIRNRYGPSMLKEVDSYLLNLTESPHPSSTFAKAIDRLNRQFYRTMLPLNPRTFVNNVVGGGSAMMPFFDAKDYAGGWKDIFSGEVHQRMMEASHIAAKRWDSPLYQQYWAFMQEQGPKPRLTIGEALKETGGALAKGQIGKSLVALGHVADSVTVMNVADSAPFRLAWSASEREVNRLHPDWTPDQKMEYVLDKFHDVTMRTQNGMTPTEASGIWSEAKFDPLTKAMVTFLRNDQNKSLNMLLQSRHADAATQAKVIGALAAKTITAATARTFLSGTGIGLVALALMGKHATEERKKKIIQKLGFQAAQDVSGLVPFGDTVTQMVQAAVQNRDPDIGDIPALRPFEETGKGTMQIISAKDAKTEGSSKARIARGTYHIVNALSAFIGNPAAPLIRDAMDAYQVATEEPSKGEVNKKLIDDVRKDPEHAKTILNNATQEGKIRKDQVSNLLTASKRTDLENEVHEMSAEEAVYRYKKAGDKEKPQIKTMVRDKILKTKTFSAEQQDAKLKELGMEAPSDLALKRELATLNSRSTAEAKSRKENESLAIQALAAKDRGDMETAGKLAREFKSKIAGDTMSDEDRRRRRWLTQNAKAIKEETDPETIRQLLIQAVGPTPDDFE